MVSGLNICRHPKSQSFAETDSELAIPIDCPHPEYLELLALKHAEKGSPGSLSNWLILIPDSCRGLAGRSLEEGIST